MKQQELKVLGLIPARGGSKTIPRKNVIMLNGVPLIAYSIRAALQSYFVNRVIVSTEDNEIAELSRLFGAEAPFLRPLALAQDDIPSIQVVRHALDYLKENEHYYPDVIVLLQPTSPLRKPSDIDEAVQKLIQTGCDSVVSISQVAQHPYWMYVLDGDKIKRFIETDVIPLRRQDLPPVYFLNGAVYATRPAVIYHHGSLLGKDTRAILMPQERAVDIDEPVDLALAELLLRGARRDDE